MPGVDLLNLRFCRCDAGSLADRARRSGGEERDRAREGRERARERRGEKQMLLSGDAILSCLCRIGAE